MPWFYVDDAFADSKPVMALDRRLRNEAIGLWVRCGAWSAKEETDGRVPLDTVKRFDGTPRLIDALHTQAGLFVENSSETWRDSREILFKMWEKWQKTRAENIAQREADAARQAAYRKSKKGRNYVPLVASTSDDSDMSRCDTSDDLDIASKDVSRCESQRPDPDPTRPDPYIPLVTTGGGVAEVDVRDTPRPQCLKHEENHDGPCRACKRRRQWDERNAESLAAGAKADELDLARRRREARENCLRCGGTSTYEDVNGVHKCNHQETQETRHA